jgi:uroporphyrinogen-III synthase
VSLAGRAILVTRPAGLAAGLAALVERAGGRAILFPAIEIVPLPRSKPVQRYDIVIFVSPSAIEHGARWLGAGAKTFAVGAGTAQRGGKDIIFPASGADSESLLALPELAEVRGRRILIVRGEGGRGLLAETLSQRGASVEYAECYRRVLPRADAAPLLATWVDAAPVSSSEALENLFVLLGEEGGRRLRETPLFVPHPRVAERAARAGVREVLVAGPSDDQMIERLVAFFTHDRERNRA